MGKYVLRNESSKSLLNFLQDGHYLPNRHFLFIRRTLRTFSKGELIHLDPSEEPDADHPLLVVLGGLLDHELLEVPRGDQRVLQEAGADLEQGLGHLAMPNSSAVAAWTQRGNGPRGGIFTALYTQLYHCTTVQP